MALEFCRLAFLPPLRPPPGQSQLACTRPGLGVLPTFVELRRPLQLLQSLDKPVCGGQRGGEVRQPLQARGRERVGGGQPGPGLRAEEDPRGQTGLIQSRVGFMEGTGPPRAAGLRGVSSTAQNTQVRGRAAPNTPERSPELRRLGHIQGADAGTSESHL